jgi:proteic killer suppression protein
MRTLRNGDRPTARHVVEVLFRNEQLQRSLSDLKMLQRRWGSDGAKKIALRLQQLAAATSLQDMRDLPGRCHELTGDRAHVLAVDLHRGYRLVFKPTANPAPCKDDGGLDWGAVDSVIVIDSVDYH